MFTVKSVILPFKFPIFGSNNSQIQSLNIFFGRVPVVELYHVVSIPPVLVPKIPPFLVQTGLPGPGKVGPGAFRAPGARPGAAPARRELVPGATAEAGGETLPGAVRAGCSWGGSLGTNSGKWCFNDGLMGFYGISWV